MDLNTVWFALIAVLFAGFFFLEGFDYGVGVLHLLLGKDDRSRRVIMNTIGPFWDGNEVWIITAGGAMFAAFPHWYATLFSGFYPALVLILFALILRGVSFEFRSKVENPHWRKLWDGAFFIGSLLPAILWGVALSDMLRGVPIDEKMNYVGSFLDLLHPYALFGGVTTLGMFTLHGALFLSLKIADELKEKAKAFAADFWFVVVVLYLVFAVAGHFAVDALRIGRVSSAASLAGFAALLLAGLFLHKNRIGWAFAMNGAAVILFVIALFLGLYPRVMVSSLNDDWSLTVFNASSTPYTLKVMSIIALIFLPFVLAYQAWTYWIFRRRVSAAAELEY